MLYAGATGMALRGGRTVRGGSGSAPAVSLDLVRCAPQADTLRVSCCGTTVIVEIHWPSGEAGVFLRCRIELHSRDQEPLRRRLRAHQTANHQSSQLAIVAMMMLLALCGWIVGGAEGVQRALMGSVPRRGDSAISPQMMYRWFGARLLSPAELPKLFGILANVCGRAGLSHLPDLYCLAAPGDMNAYALGSPGGGAIVLTEGLLRGLTCGEIAGILAHEVAHIRNNDAWTMSWAASLRCAINNWTALAGLSLLRTQRHHGGLAVSQPLAALLSAAPALGQLLGLALSRVRELDADATALELTGDSHALITALGKLERHHAGFAAAASAFEHGSMRLLRSHPATSERVGTLLSLAY